jgi:2-polyprenyl-3-methyl-5-hydroxy-6-metoxy-1,4-benzoquinol methylase
VGEKQGFRVLLCRSCTLQYSEHVLAATELPKLYDERYFHGAPAGYPNYERDELIHRARARHYLRDIALHVPNPGDLLDVGCATGFFLDEARATGWRVQGWEVSDWAAAYARRRFELDVIAGAYPLGTSRELSYDVVTFLNVFEQLPDPRSAEQALRTMVRPNGIVALETWDASAAVVRLLGMRWHKYRPQDTPVYLNRQALTALFTPEHWEVVEFRPRTKWISVRHGLHALGIQTSAMNGGPTPWFARFSLPYRLGDLVWVVLRRRAASA